MNNIRTIKPKTDYMDDFVTGIVTDDTENTSGVRLDKGGTYMYIVNGSRAATVDIKCWQFKIDVHFLQY